MRYTHLTVNLAIHLFEVEDIYNVLHSIVYLTYVYTDPTFHTRSQPAKLPLTHARHSTSLNMCTALSFFVNAILTYSTDKVQSPNLPQAHLTFNLTSCLSGSFSHTNPAQ